QTLQTRYPNPRAVDRDALLELLDDALHDRRPSLDTRRGALPASVIGPHARMAITVRGAALKNARAVVLGFHGRGASADRFVAELQRRLAGTLDDVTFIAPQAHDNTWYPKGFLAPVDDNQPSFDSALSVVDALWQELANEVGPERIVLTGFSQGACLLLTWLSCAAPALAPRRALAFTGAPTPLPQASYAAARGLDLHLSCAENDPFIQRATFEASAARFSAAGANVSLHLVAGQEHAIHAPDIEALRATLSRI
ncbi:MAG TPA: dienelactone hydrolase family protein, partial [Polyangiales bacterium]|nr:dienelactone hydrolase family protein [Polyangiales bacterium]